jgi:hypothetical protein
LLLSQEKNENRGNIVEIDTNIGQVALKGTGQDQEPKAFTFDAAYDETITQRLFYEVGPTRRMHESTSIKK